MLAVIACRLLGTCCYFLEGPDCLLLFPHMSWWLLDACWITPQAPYSTTCVTEFSWKSWTNHHLERNGKIWHNFLNSMATFGTLLLCQILPLQISPVSNCHPPSLPR